MVRPAGSGLLRSSSTLSLDVLLCNEMNEVSEQGLNDYIGARMKKGKQIGRGKT